MNKTLLCGAAVLTLAAGFLSTVGCASNDEITGYSVRMNPTPEMEGIAYTPEQRQNNVVRSWNTNMRQAVDDWDQFWLIANPLHMSNIPIP
jgi:hypothetical protein